MNTSPYFLVYGKEFILPLNIYLPALQLSQESHCKPCLLVQRRIDTLHNLEEEWKKEKESVSPHQSRIKTQFDKNSIGKNEVSVGDLVLKCDKDDDYKGKHAKFQSLWIELFTIHETFGQHTYRLQSLNERIDSFPINGQDLKHYFK